VFKRSLLALAITAALPTWVLAQAQDTPDTRAPAADQSLPMTKEVTSKSALENAQDGYSEALKNQAGVAASSSKGAPQDTITIRGINVNPVSNYRLNGGLAIAGVMTIPADDKEKLETLKGANALMFGVASPAGIINLITKRASRDLNAAQIAVNSFGQYYLGADLARRFGDEREAGLRVNVSGAHLETGVRNTGGENKFVGLGADWHPTDRLTLQGDLEYYQKSTILQATLNVLSPVGGVVAVPRPPDPRQLLSGPWATYDGDTTNAQFRADYRLTDGWTVMGEAGESLSHRARFATRIGKYNPITGAGGVVTVNQQQHELENRFERSELQGHFDTGSVTHNLTLGISRTERDTFTLLQNAMTITQPQNVFDPVILPAPVPTKAPTSLLPQISLERAVYGYDTIGLRPDTKLLLGFRQTRSSQDNGTVSESANVNSPAAGILFDIAPKTTLFASYMKGLEDGATAPAGTANVNQVLAPAISVQKEVGLRSTYIPGVSINTSIFEISRANAVIDPVTLIFSNNGTVSYRGLEAVIAYDITPRWTVNAAGQRMNAVQIAADPTINGLFPENTPKFIGNLFVTHRPEWAPGLSLSAGASYVTDRFVNPQDQGTIPGYTLLTVSANYATQLAGHKATFQVSVDNLANKRYWNSAQQGSYGIGMDRGIKASAKFEM
jgi:iron complex outermembrane receptor protein